MKIILFVIAIVLTAIVFYWIGRITATYKYANGLSSMKLVEILKTFEALLKAKAHDEGFDMDISSAADHFIMKVTKKV